MLWNLHNGALFFSSSICEICLHSLKTFFGEHVCIKVSPEHFWNIPSPDALPVT